MAKHTLSITGNVAVAYVCDVIKPRNLDMFRATVLIAGSTFGSGTVVLLVSADGGTTTAPLLDNTGTAISAAAIEMATIELGAGSKLDDALKIYATVTGSTNPIVAVDIFDNN